MPGVRVPGVRGYVVYKARIKNSDLQKGKSSGYRIIYYLRTENAVRLLTIYPKVSVGDIRPERIEALINAQIDP